MLAIFLSLPLVLLISGDRNPPAEYDATNGMVSVNSISKHLDEDAGQSRLQPNGTGTLVKTPAQYVNYPDSKIESGKVFVVEYVEYIKGSPTLIRKIGSWINRKFDAPDVAIRAIGVDGTGAYFEIDRPDGGGGGMTTFNESLDVKSFQELRKSLSRLPDNSKVHVRESFYVVQLDKDVRVYSESELPAEMKEAASRLQNKVSFEPAVHMDSE